MTIVSCRWVHEYQDACVDKLETFLRRGRRMSQQVHSSVTAMHINNCEPQLPPDSPCKSTSSHNLLELTS